jgi:cytochrome b6-f complex iron-sulfur subunit
MKTENNIPGKEELSRRSFVKIALSFLGAITALEIGGISLNYLKSRADEATTGGLVDAGKVDDFVPGSVTTFENEGFFLVRDNQGNFLAVHRRCPHLGCNVIWQSETNQFVCPCHASSFDHYGNFETSPVPRPLDTLEIKIEDASVFINTAKISSREQFDPAQMTSPLGAKIIEVANE